MDVFQALKSVPENLNKSNVGNESVDEVKQMLNTHGICLYQEKYGFLKILTGFDNEGFYYHQAPLGHSFSPLATYLHINHLGFQTQHKIPFDEFEHFFMKTTPITGFWKLFLLKIKKIPLFDFQPFTFRIIKEYKT